MTNKSGVKLGLLLPLLFLLLSSPGYAMHSIVTLTTGGSSTFSNQTSQSLAFDDNFFVYHPNHSSSALNLIVGGFIGEEYTFNSLYTWQFGVAFYQSSNSSIRGEETQAPADNLQAINYWNYQYKLSSRKLLFENKIFYTLRKRYHPYLLVGLGESLNNTSGFQVTPQNSGEVATAIFNNHLNKSFTYTLGFGLDIDVLKKMRIGLGYRFAGLGKYNLGTGTLDTGLGGEVFLIPALKPTNVFNQELLIQLTYVI